MKFQKLAIAAALGAASTLAMAGGFDGPFVQLGIGGSSTSTKVTGDQSTGSNINGTVTQGSFNGLVAAGYSQDFGAFNPSLKGFNLAANLFYVIGEQKAGNPNRSNTNGSDFNSSLNVNFKGNNTFGISVEPGWNFTDSTLGYVKLAWVNTRYKASYAYNENNNGDTSGSNSGSLSKNLNGFGYGLGVKQMITKNIYAGVDLMGVTYNSYKPDNEITFKPTQFMGFASVGYKF